MEQSKEQFVPFNMALQALYKRCNEDVTGTMYLITDEKIGAVFSLVQGRIVDAFYRSIRGSKALQLMCDISTTKFFFKHDPSIGNGFSFKNISMPSNEEIFKLFDMGINTSVTITTNVTTNTRSNTKAKKILVVEDSAMARKSLVSMLKDDGYEIMEAGDGFEALGKLGEEIPGLVLLDLILPKMDGYDVLSAMKKDNKYKKIPVIVLTSRDALFDKLKGKMSGTDEYLTKPIKRNEVLAKVKLYLG